jgi:hypothetical protein
MPEHDFLDEVIEERIERNPDFPVLVDAARSRREQAEQSPTAVAAAIQSSQSRGVNTGPPPMTSPQLRETQTPEA